MVWSVIQNFKQSLKYRGGWRNLLEHMYTVRSCFLVLQTLISLLQLHGEYRR